MQNIYLKAFQQKRGGQGRGGEEGTGKKEQGTGKGTKHHRRGGKRAEEGQGEGTREARQTET